MVKDTQWVVLSSLGKRGEQFKEVNAKLAQIDDPTIQPNQTPCSIQLYVPNAISLSSTVR
jgi:hypothetical protein